MRSNFALAAIVLAVCFAGDAVAGAPLNGVEVKLTAISGGIASSQVTDHDGNFSFGILSKGSYLIEVSERFPRAAILVLAGAVDGTKAVMLAPLSVTDRGFSFVADGVNAIGGNLSLP